jgi:ABC-2 type transport system permease protein
MTLRRTLAVARKEVVQLSRDPRSLALGFLIPPLMIVFFGTAITFDVDDIRLVVWDADRTQASSRLVDAFVSSGYFRVVDRLERYPDATNALQSGDALAVLAVPRGFARDLAGGSPAPLQLLVDGSDANTATIAIGYARAIASAYSVRVALPGREPRPRLVADIRVWYNPSLESRNMVVPGLVAVILSILAALLTALTIAREWERGTMEQLVSTPVTRLEIVVGKLLPYLAIGVLDVLLAIAIGTTLFDVPFRGSLALLVVMTVVFLLAALGFGMFLSAALKSQVLATQFAMVATYLPALLLSGFIFAIANMPRALQLATYLFPARYYVTITKAIFLKGVGPDVLWRQGLPLVALAAIAIAATVAAFRKEVA